MKQAPRRQGNGRNIVRRSRSNGVCRIMKDDEGKQEEKEHEEQK